MTTNQRLAEYGCPYKDDDPRALIWLEGFSKGHERAYRDAIASIESLTPPSLKS